MDRKKLKFLRLLVPGLALILELLPMFNGLNIPYEIGKGWLAYSLLIIPAVLLGVVYHLLGIRFFITKHSHRRIDLNITDSLLKIYNGQITQADLNTLKDKNLKHIFYNLIDNDASLTAKSQLVYFNGLLWTSTADVFLISLVTSLAYLVTGIALADSTIWSTSLLMAAIGLISIMLHILTVYKHYNLSNDQLEYIEMHYRDKLTEQIDEALQ